MGKSLSFSRHLAWAAVAVLLCSTAVVSPALATDGVVPSPPDSAASPSSSEEVRGTSGTKPPANRFIVKFRETAGITSADRAEVLSEAAAALEHKATELFETGSGALVVAVDQELTDEQSAAVVAKLAADPNVAYVEPDVLLSPAVVDPAVAAPDDPLYDLQWGLWEPEGGANVRDAWSVSQGAGQVIAVVDTGITDHSDLNAQILPGYDLISSPSMARDGDGRDDNPHDEGDWSESGICTIGPSSWHGTHVAGTVAASTDNGMGVSGVAPAAKIVPVRVLGECGGYLSDIADGIIWAAGGVLPNVPVNPYPADVINLSLGGASSCSGYMQDAVNYANSRNAVVVAAAGNSNRPVAESTPANCDNVVAVGATGRTGTRAPYSNFGAGVDIMAPGGDMTTDSVGGILSTLNSGASTPDEEDYSFYQGTSMAAPHVAGTAALLLAAHPGMTPAEVELRLKATARALPNGCSPYCGPKLLDAAAAVSTPLVAPVPTIAGTTAVGFTLTAAPGIWTPAPVTLAYQWYRGDTVITGAAAKTYKLTDADSGNTISVAVTGAKNGYTPVTKRSTATAKVAPATPFADVPPGMLFYDEMLWMATAGISTGWTEANGTKTYHPQQAVNRDAMAAFMYRLAGSPDFTPPKKSPFTDVATGNPFYKEITWLNSRAISTGWDQANGTKTYRPLQPVNRDAMAAFLYRFAQSPDFAAPAKPAFADVATNNLFYKEISWLAASGISTGWSDGTYRPLAPVKRDAMAAFMKRFDAKYGA